MHIRRTTFLVCSSHPLRPKARTLCCWAVDGVGWGDVAVLVLLVTRRAHSSTDGRMRQRRACRSVVGVHESHKCDTITTVACGGPPPRAFDDHHKLTSRRTRCLPKQRFSCRPARPLAYFLPTHSSVPNRRLPLPATLEMKGEIRR